MPVVHAGDKMPDWCELESYKLIPIAKGESISLPRTGAKEEIIVCQGSVKVADGTTLPTGGRLDLDTPDAPGYELTAVDGDALVFHAAGRWDSITSSGIFPVFPSDTLAAQQTPHDYAKSTGFDNHYHDCDEYWIFFSGRCKAVSEDKFYDVGPGDCVITGMGWHHDVASLIDCGAATAIWFEGTLEGQKRVGHLWEPVHGKAEPCTDRV